MSGRKHSNKTKKILSETKKINNPGRFKPGEDNPNYGQKVEGSGKPSQAIEVTDIKNNQTTTYNSINEAARALNIHHTSIVKYFSRNQKKKSLIKVIILLKSYNYFSLIFLICVCFFFFFNFFFCFF